MKTSKDSIIIPLTFNSKELYVGKGTLKGDKSNYKFTSLKPPEKTTTSQKYNIKEFNIINKDKAKKDIIYKGRETPQDSCYILMKYNSEHHCMQLYKANKWINFIQTFNFKDKKIEDIEGKKKEEQKAKNKIIKDYFNFEHSAEMLKDKNERKNTRKKKDILANNKPGDDLDDENFSDDGKKKKRNKYEFKEDSHSSENDPELADDSYEEEKKRRKEEEKLREEEEKRIEMEKEKLKNEKNDDNNESDMDDFDDDSFNEQPSDINDDDDNDILDLLNKKRKREKNDLEENMKEELNNLLIKNNRMTYDEIFGNLVKKFDGGQVDQYIGKILDENTEKFRENDQIYYFNLKNK